MCIFIYIYTLYLINFISVSTSDLYYFLFYIKINYILSFGLNLNGFLEQQQKSLIKFILNYIKIYFIIYIYIKKKTNFDFYFSTKTFKIFNIHYNNNNNNKNKIYY
jgi:hypothetical protein